MYRILAPVILLGLLMVAVPVMAAPSPAAVNLRIGDLPAGFVAILDRGMKLTQVAERNGLPPAEETRIGVVQGDERDFQRGSKAGLRGSYDQIVIFTSETKLRVAFAAEVAKHDPEFQVIPVHGLGTEAVVYRYGGTLPSPFGAGTSYEVSFRRGVYRASISIAGDAHAATMAHALAYAKIVDARILAASRQPGRCPVLRHCSYPVPPSALVEASAPTTHPKACW